MHRFLHFALLFTIFPFTMQETLEVGYCGCAAFITEKLKPLIEQTLPYNVTCDAEGEEKCQQLCVILARNKQESAAQMICEKLINRVGNLEIALYAKVCNSTSWKFTGLKDAALTCCREGKHVTCEWPVPVIESSTNSLIRI